VGGARVHEAARAGYGRAADVYARARPSYPPAAVDWLLAGRGSDGPIVEIGAGTGKLTAELTARGRRVVAVEPVEEMRARLQVESVAASFEELPFETASVRAVVASQSLHWADVDRAFAELDRVLAPDGTIGLVWNFRDVDAAWQRELDALLAGLRGDAPHSRDGRWERAAAASPFRIADRASWRWEVATDLDGVVARIRSVSYVAARREDEQLLVDGEVRALVARHGLDPAAIAFPYVTEAYLLRRR
jgi:SAM-dependent methyltransferase